MDPDKVLFLAGENKTKCSSGVWACACVCMYVFVDKDGCQKSIEKF